MRSIGSGLFIAGLLAAVAASAGAQEFTAEFGLDECHFKNRGANPYFILEPGYRLEYSGMDDGEIVTLRITVLDQTKWVDGVKTRVVLEEEWADGELVEISRNWLAICRETNSIVYFGEDVDIYEDGEVVSHEGSWKAGVDGAEPGIIMPGMPLVGSRYYQEVAPGVALDKAEHISLEGEATTPAGDFEGVLIVHETTDLEPGSVSLKKYARGVGLIQDGVLLLTSYGFVGCDDDDD